MTAGEGKLVSHRDESSYWITNTQTTKVDSADYIYAFVYIYAYTHIYAYIYVCSNNDKKRGYKFESRGHEQGLREEREGRKWHNPF